MLNFYKNECFFNGHLISDIFCFAIEIFYLVWYNIINLIFMGVAVWI